MSELLRTFTFSGDFGEATFFGHCLASTEEVQAAARQCADTADFRPLTSLAGNYSAIIKGSEEIIAFGGLSGQFPLSYYYGNSKTEANKPTLLVGYRPSLIAKDIGANLDRVTLGALVAFSMGVLREGHSCFENVHEIKSGEFIRFRQSQGLYHGSYETYAPDSEGSLADSVLATRTSIHESLARRLHTSVMTSDFSGGYDSSSLAFKAASMSGQVIPSFVLYHPDYPAGDIGPARYASTLDSRIDLRELSEGDDELPFSTFNGELLPFTEDEPYRTASIFGRQQRRVQAARHAGSTLHLTGTGGDALYDSQPFLADLLTRGEDAKGLVSKVSMLLARRDLARPEYYEARAYQHAAINLGQAWEELAAVLDDPEQRFTFDVGWLPLLNRNVEWLAPQVREQLKERALRLAETAHTNLPLGDYWTISQIRDSGDAQRHLMRLEGDSVHAPFLDHSVIRAALRCNAYDRVRPGRQFKPVLKWALGGHGVPSEFFERSDKGSYELLSRIGLRRSIEEMAELMVNSRLEALEIIDSNRVLEALYNQDSDGRGRAQFAPLMALEIWLRLREQYLGEYFGKPPFSVAPPLIETAITGPDPTETLQKLYVPVPSLVFAAGPDGELLALDIMTDNRVTLNPTSALIIRALNEAGAPQDAVLRLASQYPEVPLQRLRQDVAALIVNLEAAGFLTQTVLTERHPLTIPEWMPVRFDAESNLTAVKRVYKLTPDEQLKLTPEEVENGRRALDLACELTEQGFVATREYLEEVLQQAAAPALYDQALRFLLIARQLSYESAYAKHNIACYQLSLAVVAMAVASNKTVDWVMGAAFNTGTDLHVWVEVDGRPVLTSLDQPLEGFQELYRIASVTNRSGLS